MNSKSRRYPWRCGVRTRVIVPLVGVCLLLLLGSGWLIRNAQQRQSQEHIRARAAAVVHAICHLAETTSDEVVLQRFVAAMASEQDVKLIVVATGNPLVVVAGSRADWVGLNVSLLSDTDHTSRDLFQTIESKLPHCDFHHDDEDSIDYVVPVVTRIGSDDSLAWSTGVVMLHLDGHPNLRQQVAATASLLMALCGTTALATIATYVLISFLILRPVNEIAGVARRTAKGERLARVNSSRKDELGQLAADVDTMLDQLVRREAEEIQTKEALLNSQHQMESALAELACSNFALNQHAIVAITDLSGKITFVNDKFCQISQYSREELMDQTHRIVNSGHHTRWFWINMWQTIGAGEVWHDEVCNQAKDGSLYWVDTTIVPYKNQDGKITKYVAIRADITARRLIAAELAESQERFELAVRGSSDGIWDWNVGTDEVYYSPRFKELLGYQDDEFPNHLDSFGNHLHPDDAPATWAAVYRHLDDGQPYDVTYRLRTKHGDWLWCRAKGIAIHSPNGSARRMAGSISDITALKQIEEQLARDALHDYLTGLPNRALLLDRLQRTLDGQNRAAGSYALMFLDFDGFKLINDRLGHQSGDELLRQIASRLRENVRSIDAVSRTDKGNLSARMGGDEFVVLLEDLTRTEDALEVARRLQISLNQPYQLGDREVISTASIGVVLGNATYRRADDMLRDADAAMYDAKRNGKGHYVVYDRSRRKEASPRLALVSAALDDPDIDDWQASGEPVA